MSLPVHSAMGSFGQLLMDANAGMLWNGHPADLWNHSESKASTDDELKCLFANTEADMCKEGGCEEGYQAEGQNLNKRRQKWVLAQM